MSVAGASFEGSEHVNQDRWGFVDGYVWVLDGATKKGFEHGHASVGAFVDLLDQSLRRTIRAGAASLRELLRTAVATTAAAWADRPWQSATIALVHRERGGGGQWLVLCDAALAHGRTGLITDPTLARVRAREHELLARTHPRLWEEDPQRAREILFHAVEAHRDVPEGFWTASLQPDVADRALVGRLPASGPVALMSDGVTDGLANGYWASVEDAFRDWTSAAPHEVLGRYRLWLLETGVPFDDVTLVVVD